MVKRLIDANAADVERIYCTYGAYCTLEDVQQWLDERPTVDALEVIRCRDCKYHRWEQELCHGRIEHFCSNPKGLTVVRKDTFCSYGERKEK